MVPPSDSANRGRIPGSSRSVWHTHVLRDRETGLAGLYTVDGGPPPYVVGAWQAGGTRAVDALFRDLPPSTRALTAGFDEPEPFGGDWDDDGGLSAVAVPSLAEGQVSLGTYVLGVWLVDAFVQRARDTPSGDLSWAVLSGMRGDALTLAFDEGADAATVSQLTRLRGGRFVRTFAVSMAKKSLIDRIGELAALATPEEATRLLEACLSALGPALPASEKPVVAAALPWPQREALTRPHEDLPEPLDALVDRTQEGLGLPRSDALERLEVVCRAIAERLDADQRLRLERRLPDPVARLFELTRDGRPAPRAPSSAKAREVEPHQHLADGRPGSQHPVSESRPPAGQPGSPARWDPERPAHTLGSYRDERDRHGDTLASGKPGSRRAPGDDDS